MYPTYPKIETKTLIRQGINGLEVSIECGTMLRVKRAGVWYDVKCNNQRLGKYNPNMVKSFLTWTAELVAEAVNIFHEEVFRHKVLYDTENLDPSSNQNSEKDELLGRDPYLANLQKQI